MPNSCGVIGCCNRSERDNVSFYRLPKIVNFKHRKDLNELTKQRRERWLNAISRIDLNETKLKNLRVCSVHFISGKDLMAIDYQKLLVKF